MKYRCEGCMIWCEVSWLDDKCAFKPRVCLAEFKNLTPDWKEVDEDGNTKEEKI